MKKKRLLINFLWDCKKLKLKPSLFYLVILLSLIKLENN